MTLPPPPSYTEPPEMRTAITNIPCVLMALTGALLAWLGVDHWGWFLVLAFILGVVPGESK